MLTVVGWLWRDDKRGIKYTPEHANTWARMIDRHLSLPHRFVLLTDQPKAQFDPLIEPVPLWDHWQSLRNPAWGDKRPHCYVRLHAFAQEAAKVLGDRFVSIDLDCVVLDNLDPLFDRPEDFLIFHRPQVRKAEAKDVYQASMWMMSAGARKEVWEDFRGLPSVKEAGQFLGSDQAWIRYKLGDKEAGWDISDGVFGFPYLEKHGGYKGEAPPARIVFFHGRRKPWDVMASDPAPRCKWCGGKAKVKAPYEITRIGKRDYSWVGENYQCQ